MRDTVDDKPDLRVHMPIIKDIVYESARFGARVEDICRRAGLAVAELDNGDRWVDLETGHRVWMAAVELTGNPFLGLEIGRRGNPYVVGLVGFLMESAPDIRAAIDSLCRFNEVYANMFRYSFRETDHYFYMDFQPAAPWRQRFPESARQATETSLSRALAIIRRLSGRAVWPLSVQLDYQPPGPDHTPYVQALNVSPSFGRELTSLVFDRAVLDLPVVSYNADLYRQFHQLLTERLAALSAGDSLTARVRRLLLDHLNDQLLTIDQVAANLRISPRTLQRRLREEGHSFQELLEEIRRELSAELLQRPGASVAEVSRLLGYTSSSAFRRARRRWVTKQ